MMALSASPWRSLMERLGSRKISTFTRELLAAYSEPHRFYHIGEHISKCRGYLDDAAHLADWSEEVETALWFHDTVYAVRRDDNEAKPCRSSRLDRVSNNRVSRRATGADGCGVFFQLAYWSRLLGCYWGGTALQSKPARLSSESLCRPVDWDQHLTA